MEKRSPQKNKGLTVFVCIALALVFGFGAVAYGPQLVGRIKNRLPQETDIPIEINTSLPPTEAILTAQPGQTPGLTPETQPTLGPVVTPEPSQIVVMTDNGAVSSSNMIASMIGTQVLNNGGSAVDAFVATAYALAVLEPYASGLGGGGGALVYDPASGECKFFDYRDAAGIRHNDPLTKAGVPGFVIGMETIHDMYGTTDMSSLIQPAIDYAENGFAISESFARHLQRSSSKLSSKRTPQFFNGYRLLVEGEIVYQTELANTLKLIQRYGSSAFYQGGIAEHIFAAVKDNFTQEDFDNYKVRVSDPVTGTYKGYTVVSAPAPFSGTTLIQMLNIAENVNVVSYDEDVVRYAKIMASLTSVTLKDRRKYICDPDYHEVPTDLLSEEHMAELIEMVRSGNPEYVEQDPEHESTTHISVIDSNGMMVSATNTLSDFFGLGIYVDGFFLNNTIDTSSTSPEARNYCQRGQRPRSFAMPTFIFGENGFQLAIGSSGGDRIPQTVFQVICRYFNGEELQEACDKPRINMEGFCYRVEDEKYIDPYGKLEKNGFYKLVYSSKEFFGAVNAVGVKDGQLFGASDMRRSGKFEVSGTEDPGQN